MTIKLLQLNCEGGRYLPQVINFIKQERFDIIHLQEVCNGFFRDIETDTFAELRHSLPEYSGILSSTFSSLSIPSSYFGNATFFRKTLSCVKEEIIWLKPYAEYERYEYTPEFIKDLPHNAVALQFLIEDTVYWFINTHLAWGPTPDDEPYKIEQAEKLYAFLKTLKEPFILTGDFNVPPDSAIVKRIEELAINQTVKQNFTNTLNEKLHRVSSLFPPGLAVDFVFTTPQVTVNNVKLLNEIDLSDHLGITLEIEA